MLCEVLTWNGKTKQSKDVHCFKAGREVQSSYLFLIFKFHLINTLFEHSHPVLQNVAQNRCCLATGIYVWLWIVLMVVGEMNLEI